MTQLFRNSSRNALTLQQSYDRERKRLAERRRLARQAQELAAQGRGELVVPRQLQNPEVLAALRRAAAAPMIFR